jgi:hypothetical protein
MFRKLGVVLFLVMCLVGFSINPVSAKDDNFGSDYFGNININFHDKSLHAINYAWFRIFEKVADNKYIGLYDLRWELKDSKNTMERDSINKIFQNATDMLNTRNRTYYFDIGVSYYSNKIHRKNSKGYIELNTNKYYDIKATFDTHAPKYPKSSPKISLKIDEYDRIN